ncbi:MAG TPA: hypothetical protein VF806_01445 [Anaerolineaceae bacterium]
MLPQPNPSTDPEPVARENPLYAASRAIHASVDLQTILETAAQEIAHILGARKVSIQINPGGLSAEKPPAENRQP